LPNSFGPKMTDCKTNCDGCRELAVITAIRDIERLCLDGFAYMGAHPISGTKGRDVVTVDDVMAIIQRLPAQYRLT
jgi:hypothetical protein